MKVWNRGIQQSYLFYTLLLTSGSSYVNATWKAKLFNRIGQQGDSVTISGESESSCVNLEKTKICDDNDNCHSSAIASKSISTLDTCVRLFSSDNCRRSIMAIRPGSQCHSSWDVCRLQNIVKSIGGCLSDQDNISGKVLITSPLSVNKGKIASPKYPMGYGNDVEVNWIITTLPWQKIEIKFTDFEIEDHFSCNFDKVTITEFNIHEVIFEGCGSNLPPRIISRSNQILIKFKSDGSTTKKGFSLEWEMCTGCQSTNSIKSWSSSTTFPTPISLLHPLPPSNPSTISTTTPERPNISTSDPLQDALMRIGLVSFHAGENFEGNSYSDNASPGCHEMPAFFRRNIGSINDAWKAICLYSEQNCSGQSISTENFDRNTQLSNLESIGWGNKISSWKSGLKGSIC